MESSAIAVIAGLELAHVMQNVRCKAWRQALVLLLLGGFAYFGSVRFGIASAGEEYD